MGNKKTITINSSIPKSIIYGLILGFFTVFLIEHNSRISYIAIPPPKSTIKSEGKTKEVPSYDFWGRARAKSDSIGLAKGNFSFNSYNISSDTPVSSIFLDTPFNSKLQISGNGYTVGDVSTPYGNFDDYSNIFKYYVQATMKDCKYIFYFGLGYALLIVIFMNFKIKIT